jgi:SAM-dependent methyltransferase
MSFCPICRESQHWTMPFVQSQDAMQVLHAHGKAGSYTWHFCPTCGNAYPSQQPELSILQEIWDLNRTLVDPLSSKAQATFNQRIAISKLGGQRNLSIYGDLLKGKEGRRFLDIACGYGETVKAFADAGWDAYGIDVDANTKSHHDAIGIQSEICPFENATVTGPFDLIHISHAIYFITEPMSFIRQVYDLLADDGYFCISLADFLSTLDAGLPNYAHTFYPARNSMLYALAEAGFEARHLKTHRGTIYLVAQKKPKGTPINKPSFSRRLLWLGWKTKTLRHALLGKPLLALIPFIKAIQPKR